MNYLAKTRLSLENIKNHLDVQGNIEPIIENFLVSYLLVAAYAEVEQKISEIFSARMTVGGDQKLSHFIEKTQQSMLRRVEKSEIGKMAKNFGDDSQRDFNNLLHNKEIEAYSNIIRNRHSVAHENKHELSLSEFETGIDAAEKVLDALAIAIK